MTVASRPRGRRWPESLSFAPACSPRWERKRYFGGGAHVAPAAASGERCDSRLCRGTCRDPRLPCDSSPRFHFGARLRLGARAIRFDGADGHRSRGSQCRADRVGVTTRPAGLRGYRRGEARERQTVRSPGLFGRPDHNRAAQQHEFHLSSLPAIALATAGLPPIAAKAGLPAVAATGGHIIDVWSVTTMTDGDGGM